MLALCGKLYGEKRKASTIQHTLDKFVCVCVCGEAVSPIRKPGETCMAVSGWRILLSKWGNN